MGRRGNSLPYQTESFENLESVKGTINHWNGEHCICSFVTVVNKLMFRLNVDI